VELPQLVHHRRHQLRTTVAEQLGADPQTVLAGAVRQAPGAERDHDRQYLDARLFPYNSPN
jgi:hypothetical protein